jgi:hypothetical protein
VRKSVEGRGTVKYALCIELEIFGEDCAALIIYDYYLGHNLAA